MTCIALKKKRVVLLHENWLSEVNNGKFIEVIECTREIRAFPNSNHPIKWCLLSQIVNLFQQRKQTLQRTEHMP